MVHPLLVVVHTSVITTLDGFCFTFHDSIMTSYLRYIFGGSYRNESSRGPNQHSSSSHQRLQSSSSSSYIYADASGSTAQTGAAPRLKTKRSNSYSARTPTPSPLRYATFEAAGQAPSSSGESRYGTPPRSTLYRRASYRSSEHRKPTVVHSTFELSIDYVAVAHHGHGVHAPSVAQSASFGPSSRTNSSSSLLPGMVPPGPSAGSTHHHQVRYERRPSLRHNPAWQGSISSATGSTHSRVYLPFVGSLPETLAHFCRIQMEEVAWNHTG